MKQAPTRHRLEHAAYRAVRSVLHALPHETARTLGRALGALGHALDRRHRAVAHRNLALALPDLPAAARRRLVAACYRHFGAALCETVSSSRFTPEDVCHRFTLEGWEHLEAAESQNRGLFILSAHVGYWELVPPVLALWGRPLHIVVRPADNPALDRELTALRERWGGQVVPKQKAARRMLQVLQERGRVGILIDQRVQPKEGIEVPFFGHPALTTPILARLSLRTGAPVVPITTYPAPRGTYRLVVRPAIHPDGMGEGDAAVAALTRAYLKDAEEDIGENPALWLWMHRRWEAVRRG